MNPILRMLYFGIVVAGFKIVGIVLVLLFLNRFFGLPLGSLRLVDSPKANYYGCAIILCLGLLAALYFQGSFLHEILLYMAALGLGIFLIVLGILLALTRPGKPALVPLKRAALIWGVGVASVALSFGLGDGIRNFREEATRDYVAQIIVVLDRMKAADGTYPGDLPTTVAGEKTWMSYPVAYSSDGKTFRFAYDDTVGLMDAYEFESLDRIWHHYSA